MSRRKIDFGIFTIQSLKFYRAKWDAKSYDKLIVHGIPRAKVVPNFSPFILKIETYLKAAKIEYEFDSTNTFGPKTKTPWISYKGVHMGDSQLIIEYLNK